MTFNASNPAASGMVLTFDDEFNANSTSSDNAAAGTTWSNHLWYGNPNPGAISVSNGVLDLASGGELSSVDSSGQGFAQKFGYFEIDMKVPQGVGTWPAFWMMSQQHMANDSNPASEIDVMEGQGNVANGYYTTLHANTGSGADQVNPMPNSTGDLGAGNLADGFHRFGVLWSPDSNQLTYYFDGHAVGTSTKYDTTDYSPDALLIDNWLGDIGWGGNSPTGQDYAPLQIDYVRAYQFSDQNPTAIHAQPLSPAAGQTDPTALAGSASTSSATSGGSSHQGNPLTLEVSGDLYNGDPIINVTVDGQSAGTYDVSAHHAQGQTQTIALGNVDPTVPHHVEVQFTNDDWDGVPNADGHDRNVYVEQVATGGQVISGQNFTDNTASLGGDGLDPHAAVMLTNGIASYDTPAQPAIGSSQSPATPAFSDGSHNIYVASPTMPGAHISDFNPGSDILDLAPALKAAGYAGADPIADKVVSLASAANGSTAVMIDATGHDPAHGAVAVTLDHVLPQSLPAAALWH